MSGAGVSVATEREFIDDVKFPNATGMGETSGVHAPAILIVLPFTASIANSIV